MGNFLHVVETSRLFSWFPLPGTPYNFLFLCHTPLTEKMAIRICMFFFLSFFFCFLLYLFNCRTIMGFIRVIYANDRKKYMAIRANTAKYGSLSEEKKRKQPYGVLLINSHFSFHQLAVGLVVQEGFPFCPPQKSGVHQSKTPRITREKGDVCLHGLTILNAGHEATVPLKRKMKEEGYHWGTGHRV